MSKKLLTLIAIALISTSFLSAQDFEGYALYNKLNDNTTYLIDKNGDIAYSWSCASSGNYAVLLMENGNIMRGAKYNGNQLNGAAIGGMVQELDADANVVWEFIYSDADHCSHHDITLMPNGNVLLTAWEVKSTAELEQAGHDNSASERWPTHFIEVSQIDGTTQGEIVWEWHIWDHLIQDYDATKDNYGVVADHPELLDVNIPISGGGGPFAGGDWFHVNGVNYNATLDQIVFSSRNLSEILIIDHSTTTAEAASHSGGNAGKGGDFLYRWGSPSNYGVAGTQTIPAAVHDPRWIAEDGTPNGGYIQFFNNEGNNGNSTVDAINPPLNGFNYDLTAGEAYAPVTYDYRHECLEFSSGQSAHSRRPNGNLFVCVSGEYLYEVDTNDNMIWQYNDNPAKAFRYSCSFAGVKALLNVDCNCDIAGTAYLDDCNACVGGNTGNDPCVPNSIDEISTSGITIFPNPTKSVIHLNGLPLDLSTVIINVSDITGKRIEQVSNKNSINLGSYKEGVYVLNIFIGETLTDTKKISVLR